ncbi:MAG: hypothetical protein LBQ12_13690 [Deltaproteobacteria bacterium]|jgi:hypothetical protein|nr:hypothetical protein [Deltaproteobacteria bacterium]
MAGTDLKEELRAAISKALEGRKIALPDFMDIMAAERAGVTANIRYDGNAAGLKLTEAVIRVGASGLGRGWFRGGRAKNGRRALPGPGRSWARARLAVRAAPVPPGAEAAAAPPDLPSARRWLKAVAVRFGAGIKRAVEASISKVVGFPAGPVPFFGFVCGMDGM